VRRRAPHRAAECSSVPPFSRRRSAKIEARTYS
jgi:hypothetical protein